MAKVRQAYREDRLERARWLRALPWACRRIAFDCERRLAATLREALDTGQTELDLAIMGERPLAEAAEAR